MTRNAIAREVGVSPSTVTKVCDTARPPITFDRTATATAVEARATDLKARRQALATGLLDDVERLRGMLFSDIERKHMSVTNGEVTYYTKPVPGEIKDLLIAAGIGIDKHLTLVRHDTDGVDLQGLDLFLAHLIPGARLPGEDAA